MPENIHVIARRFSSTKVPLSVTKDGLGRVFISSSHDISKRRFTVAFEIILFQSLFPDGLSAIAGLNYHAHIRNQTLRDIGWLANELNFKVTDAGKKIIFNYFWSIIFKEQNHPIT